MRQVISRSLVIILMMSLIVTFMPSMAFADTTPATESEQAAEKAAAEKEAAEKAAAEKAAAEKAAAEKAAAEKAAAEKAAAEKAAAEKAAAEKEAAEKAAAEKAEAQKNAEKKSTANESKTDKKIKSSQTKKAVLKKAPSASLPDNSTSIKDGTYNASSFTFTGGTGKTTFSVDKVIIKNGKAEAIIRVSSKNYTHFFLGEASGAESDVPGLIDGSTLATGVYKTTQDSNGSYARIPVALNKAMDLSGRTTLMSTPKWIHYTITVGLDESKLEKAESTAIKDGSYKASNFSFTGGTGKTTFSCDKVILKDGKAQAVIRVSSKNYTDFYLGTASGEESAVTGLDPAKKYSTTQDANGSYATIPVALNQSMDLSGRTTLMSTPKWIHYTIKVELDEDNLQPADGSQSSSGNTDSDTGKDSAPTSTQKLGAGTWKVKSNTDNRMFYLYEGKEAKAHYSTLVVAKDGSMKATIALHGDGYDYLYMGTTTAAAKAAKSNWSKATIQNGWHTYTIPVSKLDKNLTISAHSKKENKWYQHTIIFYSGNAKKLKDGASAAPSASKSDKDSGKTSGKQTSFKNDKKAAKVSKWKDDKDKSTGHVNNSTTLKDGVYTPSSFSWSGGSGRLAYIKCNKITVKGGKSYATIVFASSHYDSLKANGSVYSKSGGGNSTFTIPVKLNANNTIIGRTTMMSQPHWIKYNIYVGKGISKAEAKKEEAKKKQQSVKQKRTLSDKAPEIDGLTFKKKVEVKHAKYFRIFRYDRATLIQIDIGKDSALHDAYKKNTKPTDKVEYDEEGKAIAKSQSEIVQEIYKHDVINYLIVKDKKDLAAGLDKDYIIIEKDADSTYTADPDSLEFLQKINKLSMVSVLGFEMKDVSSKDVRETLLRGKTEAAGTYDKPDFRSIVLKKVNFTILPSKAVPKKVVKQEGLFADKKNEEAEQKAEKQQETLEMLEKRFTSIRVPVLLDRSGQEKGKLAKAEWIKVYGAIYGCEDKAARLYKEFENESK